MVLKTIRYKHARFSTRLPEDYLYTPSHYWIAPDPEAGEGIWRVGFTKFATRMLGELVECNFEVKKGDPIEAGEPIGNVEGFKALSDLFNMIDGEFIGGNPALLADACIIRNDPYTVGWLYNAKGTPEPNAVDVSGYINILNATIQKMLDAEK